MKGAAERLEREEQQRRWAIWHTAALFRSSKFPKFEDFVKPPDQSAIKPKQDMQSLIMSVQAWHHHLKEK
jgi:hypothetical protein